LGVSSPKDAFTRLPWPAEVDRLFSPVEIANLTLVIAMINLWNRLVIGGGFHLEAA
jgi:hypothetical protein